MSEVIEARFRIDEDHLFVYADGADGEKWYDFGAILDNDCPNQFGYETGVTIREASESDRLNLSDSGQLWLAWPVS